VARDIGGLFQKLIERGSGGRRLDTGSPKAAAGRAAQGKGRLKGVVSKGRSAATTAGRRGAARVRRSIRSRSFPQEGVVTIEYSPSIDGDPDPGEVVWAWVPYEEDPSQGKDRPVVVIGRRGDRLVGVPLTSRRNDREAQVAMGTGDWDPERRPSYARIWRMLELDPTSMRREGAVLDRNRFDRLVVGVDRYYDVRSPP
jgi:hypothetical protein